MRVCTRCIMDTTDPGIRFDEAGVCNHCREYDRVTLANALSEEQRQARFQRIIDRIRRTGRKKKYDSILGISGGMDSSYVAYLVWKNGLRTLLVHMDNGWDSELAVKNIEHIVKTTGLDYYNHVIDWEEFRDLQRAYLRASVVDVEVVTDQAITALIFQLANRFGVQFILNGHNRVTEAIMPSHGWYYTGKSDVANLLEIHRRFGTVPLKTYPLLSLAQIRYFQNVRGFRYVDLLNSVRYRPAEVRAILEPQFGWRDPGGKHYESLFTKFYQTYILPEKFNVDKRKPHLSSLILSGQITRAQALERMKQDLYPPEVLREEREYVLKKLGLSESEFDQIMAEPPVPHESFPTEKSQFSYKVKRLVFAVIGRMRFWSRRNL